MSTMTEQEELETQVAAAAKGMGLEAETCWSEHEFKVTKGKSDVGDLVFVGEDSPTPWMVLTSMPACFEKVEDALKYLNENSEKRTRTLTFTVKAEFDEQVQPGTGCDQPRTDFVADALVKLRKKLTPEGFTFKKLSVAGAGGPVERS